MREVGEFSAHSCFDGAQRGMEMEGALGCRAGAGRVKRAWLPTGGHDHVSRKPHAGLFTWVARPTRLAFNRLSRVASHEAPLRWAARP
jgi:hypothetical protein